MRILNFTWNSILQKHISLNSFEIKAFCCIVCKLGANAIFPPNEVIILEEKWCCLKTQQSPTIIRWKLTETHVDAEFRREKSKQIVNYIAKPDLAFRNIFGTKQKSINLAIPQNSNNSKFIVVLHLDFLFHRREETSVRTFFDCREALSSFKP